MHRINEQLSALNLDGLLITGTANIRYVSGYTGADSFLLFLHDKRYFLTDYRYTEQAEEECAGLEIITVNRETETLEEKIGEILDGHNVKRLGFEKKLISWDLFERVKQEMGNRQFVPTEDIVESLRYIKNETEIGYIRKAAEIADRAFTDLLPKIGPGISEIDAALELELLIRRECKSIAFPIIFVSGPNSSRPHGIPSEKKLAKGDLVTIDFGAEYQGYRSDMTRTVMIGQPDERQVKVYSVVQEAQRVGVESVMAGVGGVEVDARVRESLDINSYLDFAGKGIGHGLGLEIHEKPFLNRRCTDLLQPGCVITIEPGVYIPFWGGVRIEDTLVVRENGCEILTQSPKDMIVL